MVCGQQRGLWVSAGGQGAAGSGPRGAGGGSYQQLLRDELHDQLLGPLIGLPAGGGGQGRPRRPPSRPPRAQPPTRPPLLTGSRPGSRRPGRGGPASASPWSRSRVCASVAGAGGVTGHNRDALACPTRRASPQPPRGLTRGLATAHLLPLKDATPGQQLVAEPVLAYSQAPEGEPRRGGPDGTQGAKDPSTLL